VDPRWGAKATALWQAWQQLEGAPPPNVNALQLALAQAELETNCGDAWPEAHNWGACDLRSLTAAEFAAYKAGTLKVNDWLFPDGSTSSTWGPAATGLLKGDSDPNTGKFVVWFAAFPDDVAGAKYFLGIALRNTKGVLEDAACSPWSYAAQLYLACYFGGFHGGARPCGHRAAPFNAAELANIGDYANGITARLHGIVAGLVGWEPPGSTVPAPPPAPEPPPAQPAPHPGVLAVKALQTALNACGAASPALAVDGILGPLTRAAAKAIADS
jgi:hypothetical protein